MPYFDNRCICGHAKEKHVGGGGFCLECDLDEFACQLWQPKAVVAANLENVTAARSAQSNQRNEGKGSPSEPSFESAQGVVGVTLSMSGNLESAIVTDRDSFHLCSLFSQVSAKDLVDVDDSDTMLPLLAVEDVIDIDG